jgi:hypothetical protein
MKSLPNPKPRNPNLIITFASECDQECSPYMFRAQDEDGEWHVAYGSYDDAGLGGLDHSPSQESMDYIGKRIDSLTSEALAILLAGAVAIAN